MRDKFTPPKPLNTAVLFLIFNRLDVTKQVFQAIRQAKPPRLYLAADGARKNTEGEAEKVIAVREYVLQNVDWDCEVKTLFRDKNLGCKYAVSGAIDWFFEQEEMGVILEDDCLPSQSFFWFCEELLKRYKDDMRVWHVSGNNFQNGVVRGDSDYYFSKYNHIWGWATWANRWRHYDVEMSDFSMFEEQQQILSIFTKKSSQKYWADVFQKVSNNKIDTWDYQWTYTVLANSGLSILPNRNLISNMGFGEEATHTLDAGSRYSKLKKHNISLPMAHCRSVLFNYAADKYTESQMFVEPSFAMRILRRIKRVLQ